MKPRVTVLSDVPACVSGVLSSRAIIAIRDKVIDFITKYTKGYPMVKYKRIYSIPKTNLRGLEERIVSYLTGCWQVEFGEF